jgi:hypothetical protein
MRLGRIRRGPVPQYRRGRPVMRAHGPWPHEAQPTASGPTHVVP